MQVPRNLSVKKGECDFTTPAIPAVDSVCPMLVLIDPANTGFLRPSVEARPMASISTGSPTGVPGPCPST